MPTTTRKKNYWDERGVRLETIAVTFFAAAPAVEWASFAESVNMNWDSGEDYSGDFVSIPEKMRVGDLYLFGSFHDAKTPKDSPNAHWHLNWASAPDNEPPESLLTGSSRVGGYPTVLQRMKDNWPSDLTLNLDTIKVTYSINTDIWSFRFVKDHLKPRKIGGHTLQRRAAVWSVDPPCGPVSLLSLADAHDTNLSVITASGGACSVPLSTNLRQDLDSLAWNCVNKFMEKRAT